MSQETKNIVQSIVNKNLSDAKEQIRNELYRRSGAAVDEMKPEVMDKAYNESVDETDSTDSTDDEELDEAKKDFDYTDEMNDLVKKAEKMNIQINWQEKYKKGKKARGPRNWRKHNVDLLKYALDNNKSSVDLWRE